VHGHDAPISMIMPTTSVNALNILDSVTHGEEESDPVVVPQLLDFPSDRSPKDLEENIEGMLDKATQNGMSAKRLIELRELVHEYHSIWHTEWRQMLLQGFRR
jgi:hypothetical protein